MSDKALIAQAMIPGLPVHIRTKSGVKIGPLIVDRLDEDHVLLVGEHFTRFPDESVDRVVTKTYANPIVIALDSIEAVKFVGKSY